MIEEVQVRPLNRKTRRERSKRRERYLLLTGQSPPKIEEKSMKFPVYYPQYSAENNNCVNCRLRRDNRETKFESPVFTKARWLCFSDNKMQVDSDPEGAETASVDFKNTDTQKRGKNKIAPSHSLPATNDKTDKSTLIKKLKLSKYVGSASVPQIETAAEVEGFTTPQPSTSSDSLQVDTQSKVCDDGLPLSKSASVSETNLTETSWQSAENLSADDKVKSSSRVNIESTHFFVGRSGAAVRSARTKSLENLHGMPAFGEVILDPAAAMSNLSNKTIKPKDHLYKILVIGDLGTGKTSIIKRYVHRFFSQHYRATIGVDFALKVLNWDENTLIRLQLWDIAGQERYGQMTRVYYKEAVGAFIVFDVTRVNTFESVANWKADLDSKVQLPDGSPIPCVLLANKCDQQKEGLVNSPEKMDEYCNEKGFTEWFETSAKENINIEEAAQSLVNKILLNDTIINHDNNKDGEQFSLSAKNDFNGQKQNGSKSCSC